MEPSRIHTIIHVINNCDGGSENTIQIIKKNLVF